MTKYKLLTNETVIRDKLLYNIGRIRYCLRYEGNIYYREDVFFYEFYFKDFIWNYNNFKYVELLYNTLNINFRLSKTKEGKLIIDMSRYDMFFIEP
jgi:hypothetical protein